MRTQSADSGSKSTNSSGAFPIANTLLMALAGAYAVYLQVSHGRLTWNVEQFLSAAYTLSGCLALIGPLVLLRPGIRADSGLGDLSWLTGGLLIWIFNLANLVQGGDPRQAWITPLGATSMGLTILAVMIAGSKSRGKGTLSWTNLTGWVLGLFWIGLSVYTIWPDEAIGVAVR